MLPCAKRVGARRDTAANILWLVVGEGTRLTAIGIVLGLLGAALVTRSLGALLFRVDANDPVTLVLATALLVATTLAACLVPAMRALRVDPSHALRGE